jgi:hypothetical protein
MPAEEINRATRRSGLTPEQRSLRARLAVTTRWANQDPVAGTAKARAASPGSIAYWERKVDPNGDLPDDERRRRAACAKRAHFQRLALKSSLARKKAS